VWTPGLDGPDTFTDTMDEAGPPGLAWKRLCLSRRSCGSMRRSLRQRAIRRGEVGRTPVQVCDSVCGHFPGGIEGDGVLRVDLTGVISAR
jgi:hypothetical protein